MSKLPREMRRYPFASIALYYADTEDPVGHPLPITMEGGTKKPAVAGYSGWKGKVPSQKVIEEWCYTRGDCSIGLRLAPNVVGIDVDLYGGKRGGETLDEVQTRWGKLPRTWCSTSREDGSGIYLYRVQGSQEEASGLVRMFRDPQLIKDGALISGGLEIIRHGHRFVTCFPTRHGRIEIVNGKRTHPLYRWWSPDDDCGPDDEAQWPSLSDLPLLPDGWVEGLATGKYRVGREEWHDRGLPRKWLMSRPLPDVLCSSMREDLAMVLEDLATAAEYGGAYDVTKDGLWKLVGNAAEGHCGGYRAVRRLFKRYMRLMTARRAKSPDGLDLGHRSGEVLQTEFRNALQGAVNKLPTGKIRPGADPVCDGYCTLEER